tara:strand:- start:159 stop:263 length:105 start_codon:yes stop_codon:yes gene_type:complete
LIEGFPQVAPSGWLVFDKTVHGVGVGDLDGIDAA